MYSNLLFLLIAVVCFDKAYSDCCYPRRFSIWGERKCGDGTRVNGNYCGYGKCGWFGCKCDGGCRNANTMVSFRAGDVLVCHMNTLVITEISHVMLAINDSEVINVDGGSKSNSRAKIRRSSFNSARGGMTHCHVETDLYDRKAKELYNKLPYPDHETVERAQRSVDQNAGKTVYYDLWKDNCEHWVTSWKYGVQFSLQTMPKDMFKKLVN